MSKLVSVIIPAYNSGKHIAVCLDRLLGQTYSDLEIIVVDDGSNDDTLSVCKRYAIVDSRARIISEHHRGVSAARNRGIEEARGDFIVFIDSDDYIETNLVEAYVNAYATWAKDAAIVVSGMIWEDRRNRFAQEKYRLLSNEEELTSYFVGEKFVRLPRNKTSLLAWHKLFNFITNKCYRLDIIKGKHIRFDENVSIAEDMKFNVHYLQCSPGDLCMLNMPLYHYIKHGNDSLSGRYYDGAIDDVKRSYKLLLEYTSNQQGVTTDDIYVIKSIYLMDWVSRLCALWDDKTVQTTRKDKLRFANDEIRSTEFVRLLRDSKMGKKITRYRFYTLAIGHFGLFIYLRKFYQWIKRIKGKEDNGDTLDH